MLRAQQRDLGEIILSKGKSPHARLVDCYGARERQERWGEAVREHSGESLRKGPEPASLQNRVKIPKPESRGLEAHFPNRIPRRRPKGRKKLLFGMT